MKSTKTGEHPPHPTARFANITFRGLTREGLLTHASSLRLIATVNSEVVVLANEDERLRQILNSSHATFDGQFPFICGKLRNPGVAMQKISGSDLIYEICEQAARTNEKVFLLGADPQVNEHARHILAAKSGTLIAGYSPRFSPYPFSDADNEMILKKIEVFRPEFLGIAFGCPKQELWFEDNRERLAAAGVKTAICLGGSLDFVSGRVKRAPKILQRAGVEVLWRLATERNRGNRFLHSLNVFRYIFD